MGSLPLTSSSVPSIRDPGASMPSFICGPTSFASRPPVQLSDAHIHTHTPNSLWWRLDKGDLLHCPAPVRMLIQFDLLSLWWKHVSGSKSSFRSSLILFLSQRCRKVGRQKRKHDPLQSPFIAWIKSALITADLPWGMGLINRRQYIYQQIKKRHPWLNTELSVSGVILVTCWVGGFLSIREHQSYKSEKCKVTS